MAKGDSLKFFRAFLRNPTKVGAIAPSSRILASAMIRGIDFSKSDHSLLVEFGPGTGAFTAAIHDRLPNKDAYLGIERDRRFIELLRGRFPELHFHHGSAEDATQIVKDGARQEVRAVISGLPFASLPKTVQEGILQSLDSLLQKGSTFRTFQYAHAYYLPQAVRFRRRMDEVIGHHTRQALVVRNLPPAYVLSWTRG